MIEESSIVSLLVLFAVALGLCALFSFLETMVTAIRLYKLQELSEINSKYAQLLESFEKNQNRILTTILLANNLANVIAATIGAWLSERIFSSLPETISIILGIMLTSVSILVIGEVIPKNIAKTMGERVFKSTIWITNILCYVLYPIVSIFLKLSNFIISKLQKNGSQDDILASEKEIRYLIDYISKKGLLEKDKTAMLKSIFELGTTPVKEILIPTTAIISIDSSSSIEQALTLFRKHQFSRLPVYENRLENIVGMLHLKDLLVVASTQKDTSIKNILRPILFVPDSVKVSQLLKEFKEQHLHIAMVLNEHGSIVGLVTLEDVLEEIVGDIQDEYEAITEKVVQLQDGTWLADASVELDKLEDILGIKFKTEDAVTLGGFLTEQLQHVPRKGNRLSYKHYQFQVQQASAKRVLQVLILSELTGARVGHTNIP